MTQATTAPVGPTATRREALLGTASVAALAALGTSAAQAASFGADELTYMPGSLLLELFRTRQLSPVDLLEAQIARYEAVNDKVNCVTYTHFDTAMAAAKESEQRWMNGTARPLEGITCGVKDEHHDEGWIVTQGSVLYKDDRMDHADVIVTKLKEAGAVLPIQTTVPEWYVHGLTFTKLWGVTRNPWNLKYGVGGSSGGSGAALSAGMCTIATGSDMGGSVRLPAAFNGLYGFKPPFGRVHTVLPLSPFSGTGSMARTFADMAMMQNAIAGPSPHSMTVLPKIEMPLDYPGVEGMRIAYSPNLDYVKIDQETRARLDAAAQRLRDLGAEVVEIELDMGATVDEISDQFSNMLLSGPMGGLMAGELDGLDEMTPYAAWFVNKLNEGTYNNEAAFRFELFMKDLYARIADQVWNAGYDALICSTLNSSHIPADYDHSLAPFEIEGETMPKLFIASLTLPWNLLNWCPALNVPTGITAQAMPVGMQIVGAPFADETVFRIGHAHEGAMTPLYRGDLMPDFRGA